MELEHIFLWMIIYLLNRNGKNKNAVDHSYEYEMKEDCVVSFSYAGAEP